MRYKHSTFNQQKVQFVNAHIISTKFIVMKYIDLLILKESCLDEPPFFIYLSKLLFSAWSLMFSVTFFFSVSQ